MYTEHLCHGFRCAKKSSKDETQKDPESGIKDPDGTYYNLEDAQNQKPAQQSYIPHVEFENGDTYALPLKGHKKGKQKPAVAPKPKMGRKASQDEVSEDEVEANMYDSIDDNLAPRSSAHEETFPKPPSASTIPQGIPATHRGSAPHGPVTTPTPKASSPTSAQTTSPVPKALAVNPNTAEEEGELEDIYNSYLPEDPSLIEEAQRFGTGSGVEVDVMLVSTTTAEQPKIGSSAGKEAKASKPKPNVKPRLEKARDNSQNLPDLASSPEYETVPDNFIPPSASTKLLLKDKVTQPDGKKVKEKPKEKPKDKPKEKPKNKPKDKAKDKVKEKPQGKPKASNKTTTVEPSVIAAEQEGEMEDFYDSYIPEDPSLIQEPDRFGAETAVPPQSSVVANPIPKKSQGEAVVQKPKMKESIHKSADPKPREATNVDKAKAKTEKATKAKKPKEVTSHKKPSEPVSLPEHEYYNVEAVEVLKQSLLLSQTQEKDSLKQSPTHAPPHENNGQSVQMSHSDTKMADKKAKNKEVKKTKKEDKKKVSKSEKPADDKLKGKKEKKDGKGDEKRKEKDKVQTQKSKSDDNKSKKKDKGQGKKSKQDANKTAEQHEQTSEVPVYDYASVGQVASLKLSNDQTNGSGSGAVIYDEIPMDGVPPAKDSGEEMGEEMIENDLYDQSRRNVEDIGLEIVDNELYDTSPVKL